MPDFSDMELDARPDWNEINEHKIAKKRLINKLVNIKAPSGKNKAKRFVVKNEIIAGDSNSDKLLTKVGTDSSQ